MEEAEEESNKVLLRHDVPQVVGGVGARYHKERVVDANNQRVAGLEAHEVAFPVNHNGRRQEAAAHGCCYMGSAA